MSSLCGRKSGQAVLVHCKMGISRSGSTVIAYAMKQQHWPLDEALAYVKERRSIIKPNEAFMKQLQTYDGILKARSDTKVYPPGQQGELLENLWADSHILYVVIVPASSATAPSGGDGLYERRKEGMMTTMRMMMKA